MVSMFTYPLFKKQSFLHRAYFIYSVHWYRTLFESEENFIFPLYPMVASVDLPEEKKADVEDSIASIVDKVIYLDLPHKEQSLNFDLTSQSHAEMLTVSPHNELNITYYKCSSCRSRTEVKEFNMQENVNDIKEFFCIKCYGETYDDTKAMNFGNGMRWAKAKD